jgi:moderate conductance mechanosensitive channel
LILLETIINKSGSLWLCCLLLLPIPFSADAALPSLLPKNNESAVEAPASDTLLNSSLAEQLDSNSEPETGLATGPSKNTLAEIQLFIENFSLLTYWRFEVLKINAGRLFHDIEGAHNRLASLSGFSSFTKMLAYLVMVFFMAGLLEWLFRFTILRRYLRRPSSCPLYWSRRLMLAFARILPEVLSLLFFMLVTYLLYVLIYTNYFSIICPTFLFILVTVSVIRFSALIFSFLLASDDEPIRLIRCDNATARVSYHSMILFTAILTIGIMSVNLLKYGGLKGDSLLLVTLFFGTLFIAAAGIVLTFNRKNITWLLFHKPRHPHAALESGAISATLWLVPAIIYLALLWLIWTGTLILKGASLPLAFTMSLLIIPIYLVLDRLIGSFFTFVKNSLSAGEEVPEGNSELLMKESSKPNTLVSYLRTLSRVVLIGLLLMWVLHLWNIQFAYSQSLASGIERVGFIFVIFFILWQIIDKSIGSYLARKDKDAMAEDDGADSEWGDGPLLDRSQTLLPIVRKFLGILVLVLLVLFTLSSLGVNIGPLLAGAGVMGIAIGFGAQKLVSDLLSGFFYLVDDAFRVGEYIEAGSVKGTVEKITLRNLMLRHHRGMLQIIPYSDLGSITNYMRGGVVVKFNLQFPYDTDVEIVRKVIKRVGKEMLDDPEFGGSFIKQLKSQGIREVGDSVLTIRAKFTAKPGAHFLIRREAYQRITKALNEKGIDYAHRKVIVDFPETAPAETVDEETKKKLLQAGAASGLSLDEAKKQEQAHNHPQ